MQKPPIHTLLLWIAASLVCLSPLWLSAQPPSKIFFEEYGVKDGLPEEYVQSIIQDDQGFIWFGTQNGLVKYDGYEFEVFRDEGKEGDLKIWGEGTLSRESLLKGQDGKIWLGGVGGLASYTSRQARFQNYLYVQDSAAGFSFEFVSPILEDRRGHIWFMNYPLSADTAVVGRLNPQNQEISIYPHRSSFVRKDNDFSLNSGLVASNRDSTVWLLDMKANLWKWSTMNDTFVCVLSPNSEFSSNTFRDSLTRITPTKEGYILMNSQKELYIWDPQKMEIINHYQHDSTNTNSLLPDLINYAFQDIQGNYWVIHLGGNMTLLDLQNDQCIRYILGKDYQKSPQAPPSVSHANLGGMNAQGMWFEFSPVGGGYLYYNFETKSFQSYDSQFNEASNQLATGGNSESFTIDHSGLVWVGFRPNLYKEAPKRQMRELFTHDPAKPEGLPSNFITNLYEDRRGTLWAGTDQGLASFDSLSNEFKIFQPSAFDSPNFEDYMITQLLEDNNGMLWIGTFNGLFKWNPTERQLHSFDFSNSQNSSNNILELMQTKDQHLWVSVGANGVYVLDPNTDQRLKEFTHDPDDITTLV